MMLLVAIPLLLASVALLWIVVQQANADGVDELYMRWFNNTKQFTVNIYDAITGDYEMTFLVKRGDHELTTLYFDQDSTYVLSLGRDIKGGLESHMRAIEALGTHEMDRPGEEHILYKDVNLIRAILTGMVEERFNEKTHDAFNTIRDNYLTFLDELQ